jgi:hypothetical protein
LSVLRGFRGWLALGFVSILAGCALDPQHLPDGATKAQVLQRLGPPTATYPMPDGGERLQYSRGPSGIAVNNVDLNAGGRVVEVRQELDDALFDSTVKVGEWHVDDILRTYGKPFQITRDFAFDGTVWSWHYQTLNWPRLFNVFVDSEGRVVRYQTIDDFIYAPRDRW